jgi:hypothetical protein
LFIINRLCKNKASWSLAAKSASPMGRRLHIPLLPNGQKDQEKLVDGVATVGSVSPMKAPLQSFVFGHPALCQYYCSGGSRQSARRNNTQQQTKDTKMKKLTVHTPLLGALAAVFLIGHAVIAGPIPLNARLELRRTLQFSGGEAAAVAWHQGQLWIADPSGVLRRIDPETGGVLETRSTGLSTHVGLGSYGGVLFMSYDPGGNTLVQPVIPAGTSFVTPTLGARDLTAQGGGLWYADFDEGKIVKMSTNGQLLAQFASPVGFGAAGIEWDGAHLLHTRHDGNILYFIDPADGSVDGQIDLSEFNLKIAGGLAWNGEELFAADVQRLYVFRIRPPVTMTIRVSQVEVCWNSRTNKTYQVQYRSGLTTNLWTDLGAALPGTGATICILDAVAGQEQRFYRVLETP